MTRHESKRIKAGLEPFINLVLVIVCLVLLASCGGGNGTSDGTSLINTPNSVGARSKAVGIVDLKADQAPVIESIDLLGEKRIGRTTFEYSYAVTVRNGPDEQTDLHLLISSSDPNTQGGAQLVVGNLKANEKKTLSDPVTFIQERTQSFNKEKLQVVFQRLTYDSDTIPTEYIGERTITKDSKGRPYYKGIINAIVKKNVSIEAIKEVASKNGIRILAHDPELSNIVFLSSKTTVDDLKTDIATLNATGFFPYLDISYLSAPNIFPNDPWSYSKDTSNLVNKYPHWNIDAINAPKAWELLKNNQKTDTSIGIGIIDSQFRYGHHDLDFAAIYTDAQVFNKNPSDLSDFCTQRTEGSPCFDAPNHGMNVASVISATGDNGRGVTGVAYLNPRKPIGYSIGFDQIEYVSALRRLGRLVIRPP